MGEVTDGTTTGMMTAAVADKLDSHTGGMSLISMTGKLPSRQRRLSTSAPCRAT
jgi:hypothetical protein